jgi:hypothetical protein
LSFDTLSTLPASVARPPAFRHDVATGIVHLGPGAFHRAHQAVYTDDVLDRSAEPWGICAVSLRSPAIRDALAPQGGLYTLGIRDETGERLRVVGAIREVLVAPENPQAVLARLVDPRVRSLEMPPGTSAARRIFSTRGSIRATVETAAETGSAAASGRSQMAASGLARSSARSAAAAVAQATARSRTAAAVGSRQEGSRASSGSPAAVRAAASKSNVVARRNMGGSTGLPS